MFSLTFSWLEGNSLGQLIFGIIFLFIQAVLINRLVISHRMSRVITLIPGLAYLLLMNALPETRGLHQVMMANFLAILFLLNCFPILRLYNTEKNIFNMGFWAAMSGFYFPSYFMLIILVLIAMSILRSLSLKEIGQAVTGIVTAFILVGTLFYTRNEMADYWASFGSFKLSNWQVLVHFDSYKNAIILMVMYILLTISVFNYYKLLGKHTIKEQKKIKLTYYFMVLLLPGLWLMPSLTPQAILMLCIPLAIILGIVVANWKMKLAAEFIHLLVVLGILYLHFQ